MRPLPQPADESTPLFSVLMPAFNAAETLAEAVASVRLQTFENWELVLVDDGSTDATLEIALEWTERDSRVRVLRHEDGGNHGRPATRNLTVAAARGKYLAFLDADDVWLPCALAVYADALARFARAAVVYAQAESFGSGREVATTLGRGLPRVEADLLPQLARSNVLCTSATAVLRAAMPAQPFAEEMQLAQDWACWLELARHHPFVFIPLTVARYRVHAAAGTSRMREAGALPAYEASQASYLRQLLDSSEQRERRAARAGLKWRTTTALQHGIAALRRRRLNDAGSWLRLAAGAVAHPADLVLALAAVPAAQLRVWRQREHPLHVRPTPQDD